MASVGLCAHPINWMDVSKDFIKGCEILQLEAYKCPSGIWTIGWGHTKNVRPGMKITESQAEKLFEEDFLEAERYVERYVKVPLTDYQKAALISFTFNSGTTNLRQLINQTYTSSPNIPRLNQGNYESVCIVMPLYVRGNGKVLNGLVKRREQEVRMFKGELPKNW